MLVVCVAVSMALLAAGIVLQLAQSDGAARREAIAYSAKTIRAAVDGQLEKLIVIGRIFSASPSLERGEFAEFRREAEQALQGVKGIWVVVADPAGQQIVNLATPPGAPLPKRAPEGIATQRRAFESKKPEISNIFTGVYTKKPIVTVELPYSATTPRCMSWPSLSTSPSSSAFCRASRCRKAGWRGFSIGAATSLRARSTTSAW